MKKKYLSKFIYSIFVIFIFFSTTLLAKDIVYQAEVINNYSDNTFRLRWTNYVQAYNESSPNYDYEADNSIERHSIIDNNGGSGWYQTKGITFHKNYMTSYDENGKEFGYDSNNIPFKLYIGDGNDEVNSLNEYQNKVGLNYTNLSGNNENFEEILSVDHWNNVNNGYDAYNVKGSTSNHFTINTFELNHKASMDLYEKLRGIYASSENNIYEVKFSGQLHTKSGREDIYKTAYNFFNNINGNGWALANFGLTGEKGRSALNNFDNIMQIPVAKRNVFVCYRLEGTEEVVRGITNTKLKTTIDGKVVENRYSPDTLDNNGWQEKYTTLDGIHILSGNNGANQISYNGKKYTCSRAMVFKLDGNTDWNSPLWKGENVTECTVDSTEELEYSGDLGVVYYYREVAKKEDDVQVYVNYIDQSTMTTVSSFKSSLNENKLGSLKHTTPDKKLYPHKLTMGLNQSGGVYIKDSIFNGTEVLSYNGNNYKYVGVKSTYGYDYLEAEKMGDRNSNSKPKNVIGIEIPSTNTRKVYIVSFYFKPTDGYSGKDPKNNLKVSGRLDFINDSTSFKNSTFKNSDSNGASTLDYIPAGEQLLPYIYGAQPYYIKAISYSDETAAKNVKSITLTGKWTEYDNCMDGNPEGGSCPGHEKSVSYTYNATVNHTYYKIDNLVMYRISSVSIKDNNLNKGGKLFSDNESFLINTNNNYATRSKATITNHSFVDVKFDYKSTTVSAGNNPTASDVAKKAGLKLTGKVHNDYITLDGSDSVVPKNEITIDENITSTSNTINVDTTEYIDYLGNIDNYMKGTVNKTTYKDFNANKDNIKDVLSSNQNGIRELTGNITYSKENVRGGNSFTANKVLNNLDGVNNTIEENKKIGKDSIANNFTHEYDNGGNFDADQVRRVNVLTPLAINAEINTKNSVNHSNVESSILQTGKEFILSVSPKKYTDDIGYSISSNDIKKYLAGYYITFDFKFKYTGGDSAKIYNKGNGTFETLNIGDEINANTDIYVSKSDNISIKGITTETEDYMSAWSTSNHISVVAVTKSINGTKLRDVFDSKKSSINFTSFKNYSNWIKRSSSWGDFLDFNEYVDTTSSTKSNSNRKELTSQVKDGLLNRNDLYASANHAVRANVTTQNVGRIFGFIVTDCSDLGYKGVFRKSDNGINKHSNTVYYSGKKYFAYSDIKNLTDAFMLEDENRKTLLPLGPYKNTNSTYIFAPKLGYRISYNLKTSGYYERRNSLKQINITPKYYYISKDGKTYIENIKLYYKDKSEKYREFEKSGYSIYFRPNDGYRYGISDSNVDAYDDINLSTKLEKLNVSKEFVLNSRMMLTENSGYIQNWFGEYKLPNSTIAINVDNTKKNFGHTNINDPLTDGYIGVIFDMVSEETRNEGTTIKTFYKQQDKTAGNVDNTSQWDYEGYMGVKAKESAKVALQLEKGTWNIDNSLYQNIKGTVILYDIDSRAANDFN